ncbi:MFS transporter [Burkholderia sp. S171]|uniref:MFS transporter n=1 Tax=Burkholderia sp. S171 TaxID=1641860 RepID=UPI00131D15FB|nr:MFS transporter [Burkholderia sp. S171]
MKNETTLCGGIDLTNDSRSYVRKAALGAVIGNIMEWYDFAVYGFFSVTIARLFFPTGSELMSLLLTVGTFGVGFIMRPVGAIVLGSYSDRAGRKAGLMITIMLMALGTALIGLAPTYATAGIFAPIMIVIARLIQGFSAGGEIGGSTALLVEYAPPEKKGFYGAWQQASQGAALLLGSLVGALLTACLSSEQLASWGWRVPFILGLVIAPIGFWIRRNIEESPSFLAQGTRTATPLADTVRNHSKSVFLGLAITVAWTVCTYCFLVYMPTYAVRQLHLPQSSSLFANCIGLVAVIVLAPLFGAWSDRVGKRLPLLIATSLMTVLTYPLFVWITSFPSFESLVTVQLIFGALTAMYTGPAPTLLSELFPTSVRSTGLSLAYNFAVTVFGGFAPFISTGLIAWTGSSLAPTFYVISANVVSLIAVATLVTKSTRPRFAS